MKISGPRTFLEIRVGNRQSVEVVLHVRRADVEWFNQNDISSQVLSALQTSILPRQCTKEIETNFYKYESRTKPPEHIGPGGFPLCVGTSTVATGAPTQPAATGKRRRGPTKAAAKAAAKAAKNPPPDTENRPQKVERDLFYASTTTCQIVYRMEDVSEHACATLLFGDVSTKKHKSDKQSFTSLQKLSQRIILWCYPRELFDASSINDHSDGLPPFLVEGFARPEFIPLASLFAQPVSNGSESKSKAVFSIEGDDE